MSGQETRQGESQCLSGDAPQALFQTGSDHVKLQEYATGGALIDPLIEPFR
jgi:hypothetical protein